MRKKEVWNDWNDKSSFFMNREKEIEKRFTLGVLNKPLITF